MNNKANYFSDGTEYPLENCPYCGDTSVYYHVIHHRGNNIYEELVYPVCRSARDQNVRDQFCHGKHLSMGYINKRIAANMYNMRKNNHDT